MRAGEGNDKAPGSEERTPEQDALVKAARHWVHQLARTIKSCRLYESRGNVVVERVEADLAKALQRLLEEHGTLVLRFTSNDILCEGASLYPARSRQDNLALPFYRDGVRKITFSPGIQPVELGILLGAILQVTGQNRAEDDLVTLLWQAQFPHVEIEYVPAEGEMGEPGSLSHGPGGSDGSGSGHGLGFGDGGEGGGADEGGDGPIFLGTGEGDAGAYAPIPEGTKALPWPQYTEAVGLLRLDSVPNAPAPVETGPGRSDDWQVSGDAVEAEADFEELDLVAAPGLEAFRSRLEAERNVSTVTAALELSRAFLAASENAEDRIDLVRFIPRVIREAVAQSEWEQAGMALTRLEECESVEWSVDALAQELCHPTSVVSAATGFEALEPARVDEFIAFARRFGESAVDLLGLMMAETEGSRHERRLMDAIIDECRENPERLAPWLGDPRWTVVRDTVRILGGIGGDSIAGLLRAVAEHPEQAVRDEVVTALEGVTLALAKPMLISLLDDVDSRTFCSIIQRLGQVRDAEVAELLVGYVTHPEFERQPADERRAIFAAIVTAGGDRALPELEAELQKGSLFSGSDESHRQAVAKCIAQIGTARARQVLERGARSNRANLRTICADLLARFGRS